MSTLLAYGVILFGGILVVANPVGFLVLFGLTASVTDAYGVSMYLSTGIVYFRFVMQILLMITLVISIIKNRVQPVDRAKEITICFLLCFWMAVTLLQRSFFEEMFLFGSICSIFEQLSPIYLMIILLNCKRVSIKKYIKIYIVLQVAFAFMIIYLPLIGVHSLDVFKSINYLPDANKLYDTGVAQISNFLELFTNKYAFNQLAHFHNSNDTGFFGAVGILLGGYSTYHERNVRKRIAWIALVVGSVALWFNSGMKGPIFGLIAGIMLMWYFKRNTTLKTIVKLGIAIVAALLVVEGDVIWQVLMDAVFNLNTFSQSFQSRAINRMNGLNYIAENPLWGSGGTYSGLLEKHIDPHELPLRMSMLFGITGGILTLLAVYVLPVKSFIQKVKSKNVTFFACATLMMIIAVSLTDNYTNIVLFYFLLYISCFDDENYSTIVQGGEN